uniref:Uncharacterized protein n=1 Tax=Siphoviridae sp. ctoRD1 TaxID=2825669 RepID=A0A8S5QG31_9CAUD|nr:MAG TPA: hypothetical protein [Siphoviridae sp. ctoRD1]
MIAPPLIIHFDNILAWVFDAVTMSAPAIAMPFIPRSHPAGSPSVVIITNGLFVSEIGYVIADRPFALS